VIRVGVYLTDMSQFGAINEAYRRYFAEPYPARSRVSHRIQRHLLQSMPATRAI